VSAKLGRLLKIKLHRPLYRPPSGTPATSHLVLRADGHWYALIVCEMTPADAFDETHPTYANCGHLAIGLDVGLKVFLADSNGAEVENPRYYRRGQKPLAKARHISDRRKQGSHHHRKARRKVAMRHLKIARARRGFQFKTANQYATRYSRICVQDLHICGMVQNQFPAKSILDTSWSTFLDILTHRAERVGHVVVRVPARITSAGLSFLRPCRRS
jgi:putative transposase